MAGSEVVGGAKVIVSVEGDKSNEARVKAIEEHAKRMEKSWRAYGDHMMRADRLQTNFFVRFKRGYETGVALAGRRGENPFERMAAGIGVASEALEPIRSQAQQSVVAFQSLQRKGMTLQTVFGVLGGTIGDVSGAILSLVGVAGAAGGSMYALGGSMGTFIGAAITAKLALGGVGAAVSQLNYGQVQYNRSLYDASKAFKSLKFDAEEAALSEQQAALDLEKAREALARIQDLPPDNRVRRQTELDFQQAELNLRKAKDRAKTVAVELKRGPVLPKDPFATLTASQMSFARYLSSLKDVFKGLKEAAASSFLPPLKKSIQDVVNNVFPILTAGLKVLGGDLGTAVNTFTDAMKTPKNLLNLSNFFTDAGKNIKIFGDAAGGALGAFLSGMHTVQPITERFATWLAKSFGRLDEYFSSVKFSDFLKLAGDVASKLGDIFSGLFDGLANVIHKTFPSGPNSGAGGVMLKWLNGITQGFKNFTGNDSFAKWLKDATINGTTALSTIGDFLHIFLDLAGAPETKQFWEILKGAIVPVKDMLSAGLKAGPAFGRLIVALAKLLSVFATDSGAMSGFFDTLTYIIDAVERALRPIKFILDFLGRLHGPVLAVAAVMLILRKAFMVALGYMENFLRYLGLITKASTGASISFRQMAQNVSMGYGVLGKGLRMAKGDINTMRLAWTKAAGSVTGYIRGMNNSLQATTRLSRGIDNFKRSAVSKLLQVKMQSRALFTGMSSAGSTAYANMGNALSGFTRMGQLKLLKFDIIGRSIFKSMKTSIVSAGSAMKTSILGIGSSVSTLATSVRQKAGIMASSWVMLGKAIRGVPLSSLNAYSQSRINAGVVNAGADKSISLGKNSQVSPFNQKILRSSRQDSKAALYSTMTKGYMSPKAGISGAQAMERSYTNWWGTELKKRSMLSKIQSEAIYRGRQAKYALERIDMKRQLAGFTAENARYQSKLVSMSVKTAFEQKRAQLSSFAAASKQNLKSGYVSIMTAAGVASKNAAMQSRLNWAQSLGATEAQLKKLLIEMKQLGSASAIKGANNTLGGGMLQGYGGVKGTFARANLRMGGAGMGIGLGAQMLAPQTEKAGVGDALMGAGMVASMIPGGVLVGVGLSVAGAVAKGFQAASEADLKRKQDLVIKNAKITAQKAEIIAQTSEKAKGQIAAYLTEGLTSAAAAKVQEKTIKRTNAAARKYGVVGQDLRATTDVLVSKYSKDFAKQDKTSKLLIDAAAALSKSTGIKDPQQLAELVSGIFEKQGGAKGLKAAIAGAKNIVIDTTGATAKVLTAKQKNAAAAAKAEGTATGKAQALRGAQETVSKYENNAMYKQGGVSTGAFQQDLLNSQQNTQYVEARDLINKLAPQVTASGVGKNVTDVLTESMKKTGAAATAQSDSAKEMASLTKLLKGSLIPTSTVAVMLANWANTPEGALAIRTGGDKFISGFQAELTKAGFIVGAVK